MAGQQFLHSYHYNISPEANYLSAGTSGVNQGVSQQNLLSFVVSLICPYGIKSNGDTCLQLGLMQFESGDIWYDEMAFRGHIRYISLLGLTQYLMCPVMFCVISRWVIQSDFDRHDSTCKTRLLLTVYLFMYLDI